jgi:hypothetical protein
MRALTMLDLSRNQLSGTLPPALASLGSTLALSVFDNLVRAPARHVRARARATRARRC